MKKKWIVFIVMGLCLFAYAYILKSHTYTLSSDSSEEISPILGKVKVSGDRDTYVLFRDVQTKEEYMIGYITHGISESIELEKGHWYEVEGNGNIMLKLVDVRIE